MGSACESTLGTTEWWVGGGERHAEDGAHSRKRRGEAVRAGWVFPCDRLQVASLENACQNFETLPNLARAPRRRAGRRGAAVGPPSGIRMSPRHPSSTAVSLFENFGERARERRGSGGSGAASLGVFGRRQGSGPRGVGPGRGKPMSLCRDLAAPAPPAGASNEGRPTWAPAWALAITAPSVARWRKLEVGPRHGPCAAQSAQPGS